ncbi:MAG TPA: hypothetical protein ENI33_07650, partial [Thermoplasmatales archaeon]|nr:hypothetical protein [Thermoplasmatales archaeon]
MLGGKRSRYFIFFGIVCIGISLFLANDAIQADEKYGNLSSTLYVGGTGAGNYSKIQHAIDNASNGDTIFVYSGIYYENVVINKSISLIGEDRNTTIIDGNNSGDVVYINANNANISNFTMRNSGNFYSGIKMYYSLFNSIHNCIISNNGKGVHLDSSSYNIISYCNIYSNNYYQGIYAENSDNNTISYCEIYSNPYDDIMLDSADYNQIYNCNLSDSGDGIRILYSYYNEIYDCIISDNDYGILPYFAENNQIYNCNILNNTVYGVYNFYSTDNVFFLNNFIGNAENVYSVNSNNLWNSTQPMDYLYNGSSYTSYLGNYWDDYTGTDTNGDGIGETSYNVNGDNDYYPLVQTQENYLPLPNIVYVDDDFNSGTPGWNYTHFNKIQNGINGVAENGTVYVYNGTYYENVVINKSISLIGEDRNTVIIDGNNTGDVVYVTANNVSIRNFTIRNSGNNWRDSGIKIRSSFNHISGCNILDCYDGIYTHFSYSSNNTISSCNIYLNNIGIELVYFSDYNNISY